MVIYGYMSGYNEYRGNGRQKRNVFFKVKGQKNKEGFQCEQN